jgi:hypothetical protein
MAYDERDFVITREVEGPSLVEGGTDGSRYFDLIAYNRSSIAVTDVYVSFNEIEKGVITRKWTERTSNILPGETRRILHENFYFHSLELTEISVHASDGTCFNVKPPSTKPPISLGTKIFMAAAIVIFVCLVLNSLGVFDAMELAKVENEYYKINTQPFDVSRVNATTVKIVFQGGKYKDSLESFDIVYTNPDGKTRIIFAKRADGYIDSLLPKATLPVGTIQYVNGVGSPISLRLNGNLKGGLFQPNFNEIVYQGTV